jgi:hypothetical protein
MKFFIKFWNKVRNTLILNVKYLYNLLVFNQFTFPRILHLERDLFCDLNFKVTAGDIAMKSFVCFLFISEDSFLKTYLFSKQKRKKYVCHLYN